MKNFITLLLIVFVAIPVLAQKQRSTENVFIITLDGFRWQEVFAGADSALMFDKTYVNDPLALKNTFWEKTPEARRQILLPFFWGTMAKKGQLYGNRKYDNFVNCSNRMWFSYPGYNEILTGAADDARINTNDKIDNPNVTVLEFFNQQKNLRGKVAAFGSWDVFPFIINEGRSGIPVNAGSEPVTGDKLTQREMLLNEMQSQVPSIFGGMRMDAFTHHYVLEHLKKHQPNVLFVSYGETDDFAHAGKYDNYLHAAHQTDKFIKELWDWAQSNPKYKDKTTFLITTDHGRGTQPADHWKSHGTKYPNSDQIWFAFIGPDVDPTGEVKVAMQLYQNQIAETASKLLGYDYGKQRTAGDAVQSLFKSMK